jgi:ATP-binding cassette, subfamily C, bacterial LapB
MSSLASVNPVRLTTPLVLPENFRPRGAGVSVPRQLVIALLLNLLSLALPIMMLQVYDRIIPNKAFGSLAVLLIGVLVALSFDVALRIIRAWLVGWSAASHEHMAGCAALDVFARGDLGSFEKKATGKHLQNLGALTRLREFYSGQAWASLVDLPFAGVFLALIAYLGGRLVFVPIALLVLFFLNAAFAGIALRKNLSARNDDEDAKASFVVSVIRGIHAVKGMALESMLMRRFEALQAKVSRDSYRIAMTSGNAAVSSAAFGQLSLILTATAGYFLVIDGTLSVGALSSCSLLAGRCIQPVQRILGTWLRLQDLGVARLQAAELFSLPVQIRDDAADLPPPQGRVAVEGLNHGTLFHDLTFDVMPGQILSVSGPDGTAERILLQLIAGLDVPQSGTIRLDGADPARYSLDDLSSLVGYLPRQGVIFKGTILDNLTGFRGDDSAIARAKKAARDLGIDVIVDLLPKGYQTPLNDLPSDPVPPGVKQRIALARVFARNPAILLFENADRALDKEGYNLLFRQIGRMKGRTTILLATRDQNLLSFADHSIIIGGQAEGELP